MTPLQLDYEIHLNENINQTQIISIENLGNETLEVNIPNELNIYYNDFESYNFVGWSSSFNEQTSSGNKFLGRFGNSSVSLNVNDLFAHDSISISFDLLIIDSWDGNNDMNTWHMEIDDNIIFDTNFSCSSFSYSQCYPENCNASYPAGTGSTSNEQMGFSQFIDSYYHIEKNVQHDNSELNIEFIGLELQSLADESWGIDNFSISTNLSIPLWLFISDTTITIPPGSTTTIEITANGEGLEYGFYQAMLLLVSNDPDNPIIEVPITLDVFYPHALINEAQIEFGEIVFNTITNHDLEIINTGNDVLEIFSVLENGNFGCYPDCGFYIPHPHHCLGRIS